MKRSVQDRFIHTGALVAGRYRLLRGLGAGASGLVYLARDVVDGADVAVKVLRDPSQGRTNLRERFEREAEALRRVTSPFGVRTLDFGLDNAGLQFLVMEYLDGMNAGTLVARDGPFRGPRLYALADQIFCGIAAMHRAGVVHRDVKPHNVVIVQGVDGGESAKLIDLGLAKPLRGKYKTLTALAPAIGTPALMSPEQARGARDLDARSDVFSAGVVLYQCLTGALPFAGETWQATLMAVASCAFAPPRALRPAMGGPCNSRWLQCPFQTRRHRAGQKAGAILLVRLCRKLSWAANPLSSRSAIYENRGRVHGDHVMLPSAIPVKTQAGRLEIDERKLKIGARQRMVLISINGERPVSSIRQQFAAMNEIDSVLDELLANGLIEVPQAAVPAPAAAACPAAVVAEIEVELPEPAKPTTKAKAEAKAKAKPEAKDCLAGGTPLPLTADGALRERNPVLCRLRLDTQYE